MITVLFAALVSLTVHVSEVVEGLTLVVVDPAGTVVGAVEVPEPGDYVFEVDEGLYTIRAVVADITIISFPDIAVPRTSPLDIAINEESLERAEEPEMASGSQRNQNIQVNLIDNQAITESLGRQGGTAFPITEFSAVRGNYAAELGGMGPDPQVVAADQRNAYHGEIYDSLQNSVFNARTFFQVGPVQPSRRNQYGFRIGGPLGGGDRLSFVLTGEETRESGFVNGNVLVPLPDERTPRASDPAVNAELARWLSAYPDELPNRPEIDKRLLNTNAIQTIRNSGGTFQMDWSPRDSDRVSLRYSINDNFIDSFEFVVGQNPNQRLRPQTLNLGFERLASGNTTFRLGFNYLRRKVHVLVPPGSVGPYVFTSFEIEPLGPRLTFPVRRVSNDFQYLVQGTTSSGRHQLDWGGGVVRSQLNEFQSDGTRGNFSFRPNFGRSALENILVGEASDYLSVQGDPYRGFRRTDWDIYVNDRIRVTPNLNLTLGLRYEFAGTPSEVNDLTAFSYDSDANNFAPRVGLAYSVGRQVFRAGYGISFGEVFPATYRVARLNPPAILPVSLQSPDLLDPLGDFQGTPGETPRSGLNLISPDLVTPYSHQYSLQIDRELPAQVFFRVAYVGSRTLKLFRSVRGNRAVPVEGIERTTATINLRRPDPRYFTVAEVGNRTRAYFDALQLAVEKVFSQGLALRANYSFSKALDTGGDFYGTGVSMMDQRAQTEDAVFIDLKSFSRFDAPQSFVFGYSWEAPSRLGGWTLSGTAILRSGTPFTVDTGSDAPPVGNVDGEYHDRPSILDTSLIGRSVDDPDTALQVLKPSAFDPTAPFREGRGNLSTNALRKDGITNFNFALSRTFPISRDQIRTVLFRAEAINAFNHPQFEKPNSSLSSQSFGQITNTLNAGRILQFHLRFAF